MIAEEVKFDLQNPDKLPVSEIRKDKSPPVKQKAFICMTPEYEPIDKADLHLKTLSCMSRAVYYLVGDYDAGLYLDHSVPMQLMSYDLTHKFTDYDDMKYAVKL